MPLQRSYDVTISAEEGAVAPKKNPLNGRACMLRLLGFFLFCAVVLILCLVRWPFLIPAASQSDVERVNATTNSGSNAAYDALRSQHDAGKNNHPEEGAADKNRAVAPTPASPASESVTVSNNDLTSVTTSESVTVSPNTSAPPVPSVIEPSNENANDVEGVNATTNSSSNASHEALRSVDHDAGANNHTERGAADEDLTVAPTSVSPAPGAVAVSNNDSMTVTTNEYSTETTHTTESPVVSVTTLSNNNVETHTTNESSTETTHATESTVASVTTLSNNNVETDTTRESSTETTHPTESTVASVTTLSNNNVETDTTRESSTETTHPTESTAASVTTLSNNNVETHTTNESSTETTHATESTVASVTKLSNNNVETDTTRESSTETTHPTESTAASVTTLSNNNVETHTTNESSTETTHATESTVASVTKLSNNNVETDTTRESSTETTHPTESTAASVTTLSNNNVETHTTNESSTETTHATESTVASVTTLSNNNVETDTTRESSTETTHATESTVASVTTLSNNSVETDTTNESSTETTHATESTVASVTTLSNNNVETDTTRESSTETTHATESTVASVTTLSNNSVETDTTNESSTETTHATESTVASVTTLSNNNVETDTTRESSTETTHATESTVASVTTLSNNSVETDTTRESSTETTHPTESTVPSVTPSSNDDSHLQLGSQIASQMLFYMNHSGDACEDLYEYACGRFEANHLMSENDLSKQAMQRIYDQAKKIHSSGQSTEFFEYYQSCVTHYTSLNETERILLGKFTSMNDYTYNTNSGGNNVGAPGTLGLNRANVVQTTSASLKTDLPSIRSSAKKAFDEAEESIKDQPFDFTDMLSKLLLRNSAPLFDITLDLAPDVQDTCEDEVKPVGFTFKLGPPELKISLYENEKEVECRKNQTSAMQEKNVSLEHLYKEHAACKSNLGKFVSSFKHALEAFNVSFDERELIGFTVELDLMPAFSLKYPAEGEIRRAYISKAYTSKTIAELQKPIDNSFLNWTRLLQTLTDSTVKLEQPLQVYFPNVIVEGLVNISNLAETLKPGLLAYYAHKIYYEFVVPPPDVEYHCKRVATNLMRSDASSLYMSSFSPEELAVMNATVIDTFEELKNTLKSGVKNTSWLIQNSDNANILKKIENLTIAVPDKSLYEDGAALSPKKREIEGKLTGKFVDDTIMLQKNYRKSMYRMLLKSPSNDEQIWTHFALPYQTTGSAIHGLNKIIIPYGAVDWDIVKSAEKLSSPHLVLATLGTRIAEQIAHHFDTTGMQYNANQKNSEHPAVFCDDDDAAQTYARHMENYKSLSTDIAESIDLPLTEQKVEYTMTSLSLDERFSAITGLQLAYDTMSRLSSDSKKLLPWLTNQKTDENKQFFLAYAQMHCTKLPLTSSFVSLYEDEHLPSRLAIFAVASNSEALRNTWTCPAGWGGRSGHVSSIFPYLEVEDEQQHDDQQASMDSK